MEKFDLKILDCPDEIELFDTLERDVSKILILSVKLVLFLFKSKFNNDNTNPVIVIVVFTNYFTEYLIEMSF